MFLPSLYEPFTATLSHGVHRGSSTHTRPHQAAHRDHDARNGVPQGRKRRTLKFNGTTPAKTGSIRGKNHEMARNQQSGVRHADPSAAPRHVQDFGATKSHEKCEGDGSRSLWGDEQTCASGDGVAYACRDSEQGRCVVVESGGMASEDAHGPHDHEADMDISILEVAHVSRLLGEYVQVRGVCLCAGLDQVVSGLMKVATCAGLLFILL
jgi:hypothetical protein